MRYTAFYFTTENNDQFQLQVVNIYELHSVLLFVIWCLILVAGDAEVHIVISNSYKIVMKNKDWTLMTKCAALSAPILTKIFIERPCISQATGRYIYVVMINRARGMGINEFKVHPGKYCFWEFDQGESNISVNSPTQILYLNISYASLDLGTCGNNFKNVFMVLITEW